MCRWEGGGGGVGEGGEIPKGGGAQGGWDP